MSAQPKVTFSATSPSKPVEIRQAATAAKPASEMMPEPPKPTPVRYDFVGIAG